MKHLKRSLVVIFLLCLSVSLAHAAPAWTTKRLSFAPYPDYVNAPKVALSGANVYAIYPYFNWDQAVFRAEFRKSADGGSTWSRKKRLSPISHPDVDSPAIAAAGRYVYVVWSHVADGLHWDLYCRKSDDYGESWSATKRLTWTSRNSRRAMLAVAGATLYVAWEENGEGESFIMLKKSDDRGDTWSPPQRLSRRKAGIWASYVSIAADRSDLYVVWRHFDASINKILFRKSADRGGTWSSIQRLSSPGRDTFTASITAVGRRVYAVWSENRGNTLPARYEVMFRRSWNRASTWTNPRELSKTIGEASYPAISASNTSVYVTWLERLLGSDENRTYFRYSADFGKIWSSRSKLTPNTQIASHPSVTSLDTKVYVVWGGSYPYTTSFDTFIPLKYRDTAPLAPGAIISPTEPLPAVIRIVPGEEGW